MNWGPIIGALAGVAFGVVVQALLDGRRDSRERAQDRADLEALRTVARGYCPECGRGDCAPDVTDWERERRRANAAEATIRLVLDQCEVIGNERCNAAARITAIITAQQAEGEADPFDWPAPVSPKADHQ